MAEHPAAIGGETATVEHPGGGHAEPTVLGLNPPWFIAAAMVVVIAIILWKKVPSAIIHALDKKIDSIRVQLAEGGNGLAPGVVEIVRLLTEAREAAVGLDYDVPGRALLVRLADAPHGAADGPRGGIDVPAFGYDGAGAGYGVGAYAFPDFEEVDDPNPERTDRRCQ